MSSPSTFGCLACGVPAQPELYYCEPCLAGGRRMGSVPAQRWDERAMTHVVCPDCGERSPAYADVEATSCLHCFRIVDLVASRTSARPA